MALNREPKYPSRRTYVLKVRRDAKPDALARRLENLVTGRQSEFASSRELLDSIASAFTPRESMPEFVQNLMLGAPNTHFVMFMQTVLFRGAGIEAAWPQLATLALIGSVLFGVSLNRFRRTVRFKPSFELFE